ncbi:MAG: MinD/ParA family protein [Deltaproteobacteria bacterium]|nr:MinD/ParA family protein [Deltaproteobacteria bacterium]
MTTKIFSNLPPPGPPGETRLRVFSVTSGKGGVGKTSIVTNLAVAFAKMGRRVLIIDADLGLANVDILLGLTPAANIHSLLRGERRIEDILTEGPCGVRVLPASSGIYELTHLSAEQRISLLSHLDALEDRFDTVLIDTGAGIASNVMYFNAAAQEIIVVVTPENTSIADAYALIKVLTQNFGEKHFHVLLNMVQNEFEAINTFRKIERAAARFLNLSLNYSGFILRDENVRKAANAQKALVEEYPVTPASRSIRFVAEGLLASRLRTGMKGTPQFFWKRLLSEEQDAVIQGIPG